MVLSSPKSEEVLVREVIQNGISIVVEKPGKKRSPEASLLVVISHVVSRGRCTPQHRAARNGCSRQLDAAVTQLTEGRLVVLYDSQEAGWWRLPQMQRIRGMPDVRMDFFDVQVKHRWDR